MAMCAYSYAMCIGIVCSLLIAGVAVNFGPEKTLEWLGMTGLTMVWRLFIIEPVKVLWCGGLEAVASLITGAPHRYGCARTRVARPPFP